MLNTLSVELGGWRRDDQRVERARQPNKAAHVDHQQNPCQKVIDAASEAGAGYYFLAA